VEAISGPEELRAEAVRVIKKSGKWTPAVQNGRQVKSYKKQPIVSVWRHSNRQPKIIDRSLSCNAEGYFCLSELYFRLCTDVGDAAMKCGLLLPLIIVYCCFFL